MVTEKTVQSLARELSQTFEQGGPRNDGATFRKLKENHPEWMQDLCHEAHGDMMPDDLRYEFIEQAADALADHDDEDEARASIEADIYTNDLTAWLASRADRHGYCDEAMEEMGGEYGGIIQVLQMGQVKEKEEVFQLVLDYLTKMVEEAADAEEDIDEFTQAYIEAALWSTNDESGEPLDKNYGVEDISPDTLAEMKEDCKRFQEENANLLTDENLVMGSKEHTMLEYAGHDFWLTRNGHGAGFWDGDWEQQAGEVLTAAAKTYGEFNLYVGDDGTIDS